MGVNFLPAKTPLGRSLTSLSLAVMSGPTARPRERKERRRRRRIVMAPLPVLSRSVTSHSLPALALSAVSQQLSN